MKDTRLLIASLAFAALPALPASAETYFPGEGDIDVAVYQTTGLAPFREIPTTPFTVHMYTNRAPIDVDAAEVRGRYSWLGVSMSDAACWVLSRLPEAKRRELLEMVFSPTKGAGLSGVRLNIGASDYSTAVYDYDETPGDVEMRDFSVARDDRWVFPMVKEAMAVNPAVFAFGAPWSPPSWMKTTGNFIDGNFKDGCEQALANYLTAYAREVCARGIPLKAVSINNEVNLSTRGTYPSCVFSAEQESRVAKILGPQLARAGLPTKVWLWDHNYNLASTRVAGQLADPELRAAIGAVAWHSYRPMDPGVYALKAQHPDLPFYHTEMGPAIHDPKRNEQWWCRKLSEAFESGIESFTSWNLCLTPDGQPLTGPHLCAGLVEVDLDTFALKASAQLNLFRHVGPFVKPGAEVLRAGGDKDGMETLLFRNPGGEIVLVAACSAGRGAEGVRKNADASEPRPKLYVKYAGEMKHLPLPYGTWSVTTVVFKKR